MAETKNAEKRVLLELEYLHECYNAVLLRKMERGPHSVRTRQGYVYLRSKYQPRLRFLHEAGMQNVDSDAAAGNSDNSREPSDVDLQAETQQKQGNNSSPSRFTEVKSSEDDDGDDTSRLKKGDDDEREILERVVGVYFDPRIKRFITDVCWPLAHFGDHSEDHNVATGTLRRLTPEWKELEQDKYFVFTFTMMLWLFPGLPGFEAQDQAERDWQKDCEFDAYGSYGLSYEGFAVSLIDLATACTNGTVEACLEFLEIMVKRLQVTLPLYRDPAQKNLLPSREEGDPRPGELQGDIQWRQIPLERLIPCQLQPKAQYYELKAKLSVHPLVLMVLLGNEKPAKLQLSTSAKLQLSTSAKLLIRERDSRTSIRRKTIALKSHFVELEKQFLWTFRDLGDRPSLLLIPNHCISRRTLSLYACLRLIDGREQELQRQQTSKTFDENAGTEPCQLASAMAPPPILTLFSNIQEPFPLMYGAKKNLCGRVDRQSTRLFIIDHRERTNAFAITLKTSLIQNTTSGGGAGVAAVVAAMSPPSASITSRPPLGTSSNPDSLTAHSFIFVVKVQDEFISKPNVRVQKMQATLPQQWYTILSGSNESKSILIDAPEDSSFDGVNPSRIFESDAENSQDSQSPNSSAAGLYYLYIFSLHGLYFEALYEDQASAELSNSGHDHTSGGGSKRDKAGAKEAQNSAAESPEETDAPNDSTSADLLGTAGSILNSATLLRRLLLLRKKRQKEIAAQPPPDLLEESKVTNIKLLSAAGTLESKFLCARATERQVRLLKNAESIQTKVIAKLTRPKKKHKLLAGRTSSRRVLSEPSSGPATLIDGDISNLSEHSQSNEIVKIDAKVALLSEFFKEMAVFQPSQNEMRERQSQRALDDKKEDAPLEHFSNFFESDTALQNLLDEEKWLSTDEKAAKRKVLTQERTLKSKGEAKLLKVGRSNATEESTLTSDDYYSTAQYIEELMREVANEETKGSSDTETATHSTTQEDVDTAQLAISWTYAQHRTQPQAISARAAPTKSRDEKRDLHEFVDGNRRDEWMRSPYIQQLATSEYTGGAAAGSRHHTNLLRSPFVPMMQSFHDQELSMPWQAVWEAPVAQRDVVDEQFEPTGSVGAGIAYEARAYKEHQQSSRKQALYKNPHRPPERPKAAAPATRTSTWSGASPRREQVNTASQSATFSYHNSKRIRSAQVRVQKSEPTNADLLTGRKLVTPSRGHALGIDSDFKNCRSVNAGTGIKIHRAGYDDIPSPIAREMARTTASPQQGDSAIASFARNLTQCGSISIENHHLVTTSNLLDPPPKDLEPPPVVASISKQQSKSAAVQPVSPLRVKSVLEKKKPIKIRTDGEKRFARQVRELLTISMELKQSAESERASASKVESGCHLVSFPPHRL